MDTEVLKIVGQVAGIGGIALGVFLLLFRDVIRKSIFPSLSRQQGYRVLLLILVLIWTMALAGIGAWVYVKTLENKPEPQLSGVVLDREGKGIPDVVVSVVGHPLQDQTTTSGSFSLKLQIREGNTVRLQAYKEGYISWNENVVVPKNNLRILLLPLGPKPSTADTTGVGVQDSTSATGKSSGTKNMKKSGPNNKAVEKTPVITDQTVNRPS